MFNTYFIYRFNSFICKNVLKLYQKRTQNVHILKATITILTSRKSKKGHPLCAELHFSQTKRQRKIIGYTEKHFWDNENKQLLKQHPEYYLLWPIILEYKAKCVKINYGSFTIEEAKRILFEDETFKPTETMFLAFFDVRIQEKQVQNQSYQSYKDVKNIISTYISPKQDIAINDITYEWLNNFILSKIQAKAKIGGVMSYLRTMRAIYKEAQRRTSLRVKQDNPFIGIMKTPPPKPVIEVSPEKMDIINSFVPHTTNTTAAAMQIRNLQLLLFQFYIGGHDFIDVALIEWKYIKKDRITFKRYKNRNKKNGGPTIDNKLFPEALQIIETFGTKNTERIFDFIPNPITQNKQYNYFRRTYNRSLESISKNKQLPENLKSKSTRYLFRTYAGELLTHNLIVMKLQGHTPEGITYNYQGNISYKVIDQAHRNIIDYLLNENDTNLNEK